MNNKEAAFKEDAEGENMEWNEWMDRIAPWRNVIIYDIENSIVVSDHYQTLCYAIKIDGLDCGIWFSNSSGGVYGTDDTKKLLSTYWDIYADEFENSFDKEESVYEKITDAVLILVGFLEELKALVEENEDEQVIS